VAEAFLRGGAIGYIGSVWDIHDTAAAQLAVDFYMNSRLHSMGEALRKAKEKAYQERNIAWLCFVLFGDPTLQLI
jgi:CHAT domain-containing protein